MTNSTELTAAIKDSGYKRSHIAKKLGISTYSLSNKIYNKTQFKSQEISRICHLLNIDNDRMIRIFFADECDLKSHHDSGSLVQTASTSAFKTEDGGSSPPDPE